MHWTDLQIFRFGRRVRTWSLCQLWWISNTAMANPDYAFIKRHITPIKTY